MIEKPGESKPMNVGWPALACVDHYWSCVGLRWLRCLLRDFRVCCGSALTVAGLCWPTLVVVGLALAVAGLAGLRWLLLAAASFRWPTSISF
jgi:hypothetical protein